MTAPDVRLRRWEVTENAVRLLDARNGKHSPVMRPAPAISRGPIASTRRRLTIYDDSKLIALPEVQWDIPGIIPRNALVQVFGPYATYKSFIALLFAFSRQLGLALHGLEVRAGPVFYICAEGSTGMRQRVAALKRYLGIELAGVNFIPQSVHLNVAAEVEGAVEDLRELLHPDAEPWVIVDTRSRCFLGNENASEDMSAFVRGCDTLRQELNATVIVIHHPGWANDGRGRGAYDFDASCDTIIRVERDRDQDRVTLSCMKMKDGPEFAPLAFEAVPFAKSLVFNAVGLSDGKLTGQRLQALEALHQNPTVAGTAYTQWQKEAGIENGSSFDKARDWLKAKAYVEKVGTKWMLTDAGKLALSAINSTHPTTTPPDESGVAPTLLHQNGGVYNAPLVGLDGIGAVA